MAWQRVNWKLTRRKLLSTYNMLKLCYWCENMRQTDHVVNMVPESHLIALSQAPCQLQIFLQAF